MRINTNNNIILRFILILVLFIISFTLIVSSIKMSTEETFVKGVISNANKGKYKEVSKKIGYFDFSELMELDTSDYDREDTLSIVGINISGGDIKIGKVKVKGIYEIIDKNSKSVQVVVDVNYIEDGEKKSTEMLKSFKFKKVGNKWKFDRLLYV